MQKSSATCLFTIWDNIIYKCTKCQCSEHTNGLMQFKSKGMHVKIVQLQGKIVTC